MKKALIITSIASDTNQILKKYAEKAIEKTKNTADEDLNINESEIVEEE